MRSNNSSSSSFFAIITCLLMNKPGFKPVEGGNTMKILTSEEKFEKIGVELQMNSNNFFQAQHAFEFACNACMKDQVGGVPCEVCAIREAFIANSNIMMPKMTEAEKRYIQLEKELR